MLFHVCTPTSTKALRKFQIFLRRIIFSKSSAKGTLCIMFCYELASFLVFQLSLCFSTTKLNLSSLRILSWKLFWKDMTMNLIQPLKQDLINNKISLSWNYLSLLINTGYKHSFGSILLLNRKKSNSGLKISRLKTQSRSVLS